MTRNNEKGVGMRFRVLSWDTDEGKDLAITVVRECDAQDISIKRNRVGFECDDTTMVVIISALRDAINKTVFINCI